MTSSDQLETLYVLQHGKHSGFLLAKPVMEAAGWLGSSYFPDVEYIEFGWGDDRYYPARGNRLVLTVRAIAWPTPTVIHVVGFRSTDHFFEGRTVVQLDLPWSTIKTVAAYIARSFRLSADGELIEEGRGLYGNSWFFSANGKFHLFHTCNTWTAKGLRAADLPVTPWYTLMTGTLMKQVSKIGQVVSIA